MITPAYPEHECLSSGPCAETRQGVCADCGEPIPDFDAAKSNDHRYRNMNGSGFQSQTATHNHIKTIKGLTGFHPVKRELCAECYTIDWGVKYPPKNDSTSR